MTDETVDRLIKQMPVIRRARGYRLYDHRGRRYLDLYQQGGRSLLGHRPSRQTGLIKDLLSRGLAADLPSVYRRRLEKALLARFPAYQEARVTASFPEALELASRYLGRKLAPQEIRDPLTAPGGETEAAFWRPLLAAETGTEILFPLLPFCLAGAPSCVCFRQRLPASFPDAGPVSAVVLAGALRALSDLDAYRTAGWFRPDLLASAPGWTQRGIYLLCRRPPAEYERIFLDFLTAGLLLSPCCPGPSILPAEASPGEVKKMLELFHAMGGQ